MWDWSVYESNYDSYFAYLGPLVYRFHTGPRNSSAIKRSSIRLAIAIFWILLVNAIYLWIL